MSQNTMKKLLVKYQYKRIRKLDLLLPAKPLRYLNPFLLCFMSQKQQLDKELGIIPRTDIVSKVKDDWNSYTDEQKAPFIKQSENLRYDYHDQMRYYDNHYNIRKYMISKQLIMVHHQMAKLNWQVGQNRSTTQERFSELMKQAGPAKSENLTQTELDIIDVIHRTNLMRQEQIFHEIQIHRLPKLLINKRLVQRYVDSNILGYQMPNQTYREFLIQHKINLQDYDSELAKLAKSHKDTIQNIELASAVLLSDKFDKVEENTDFIQVLNSELA